MTKPENKAPIVQKNFRPWAATGVLLVGALLVFALTWFGAQYYASNTAKYYGAEDAKDWSNAVIKNFSYKKQAFTGKGLKINDKYMLKDFQKGTKIFQYRLVDASGRVFWSSHFEDIGMVEKRPFFTAMVKSGTMAMSDSMVSARHVRAMDGGQTESVDSANSEIAVVETAVPVMDNGKFVGAIFALQDIDSLLAWSKNQASRAALFLCAAIAIVFLAVLAIIWMYSFSRNKQAAAMQQSREKAEAAEQEAREMAEQLQVMNDDISSLNKELSISIKTLHETQDEVIRKGKMAQLGQLTATVAHDIRNPLGSIRTSTFLMRRKFATDNPLMEKPLGRIENGVERCDKIITELLDFARTKDLNLQTRKFDDWVLGLVSEQAESMSQEISFELNLRLGDLEVTFDSDSLARTVINFLSNAAEAMVGKGNDLPSHPTKDPKISISTAKTNRGIEISVADNGPGIPADIMPKILDPLFTTKSFGVGLGLPAVEKIFEKHDGGMEVNSVEGHGATFTGWINCKGHELPQNKKDVA